MDVFLVVCTDVNIDYGVDEFLAIMFHGLASRGGKMPSADSLLSHLDTDRPLNLCKNAYKISDVFTPNMDEGFVFSHRAKTDIERISKSACFEEVIFRVSFEYPFRPGDFSHFKKIGNYRRQMAFVDALIDNSTLVNKSFHLLLSNDNWSDRKNSHYVADYEDCIFGNPAGLLPRDGAYWVNETILDRDGFSMPYLHSFMVVNQTFLDAIQPWLSEAFYTVYKLIKK